MSDVLEKLVELNQEEMMECDRGRCWTRLTAELERYAKEPEPEHAAPIELLSQDEMRCLLWCRNCGRIAEQSGAYYDEVEERRSVLLERVEAISVRS